MSCKRAQISVLLNLLGLSDLGRCCLLYGDTSSAERLFNCVGNLCGSDLVPFLMFFALNVILHDDIAYEIARAGHAVMLAHARFVLIKWLVRQLLSSHRLHVLEHDLIYVTSRC